MNPLRGCFLKIERSLEHLNAFNEARELAFEGDRGISFLLHGQANSQRTQYFFRVQMIHPLPLLEWGIFVGDAVHSLRSALDQMVWAVADTPHRHTAFPICLTEKEWVIDAPAKLWSVPDRFKTLINDAQPYHRGDAKAARTHPVSILSTLSNLDKHRTIPTAALVPTQVDATVTLTEGIADCGEVRLKGGAALEDDAVIAQASIKPDDSGLEPKVDMESHFTFEVAFGRDPIPAAIQRKPVVETFNNLFGTYVLSVIASASALLGYPVEEPNMKKLFPPHGVVPPHLLG